MVAKACKGSLYHSVTFKVLSMPWWWKVGKGSFCHDKTFKALLMPWWSKIWKVRSNLLLVSASVDCLCEFTPYTQPDVIMTNCCHDGRMVQVLRSSSASYNCNQHFSSVKLEWMTCQGPGTLVQNIIVCPNSRNKFKIEQVEHFPNLRWRVKISCRRVEKCLKNKPTNKQTITLNERSRISHAVSILLG